MSLGLICPVLLCRILALVICVPPVCTEPSSSSVSVKLGFGDVMSPASLFSLSHPRFSIGDGFAPFRGFAGELSPSGVTIDVARTSGGPVGAFSPLGETVSRSLATDEAIGVSFPSSEFIGGLLSSCEAIGAFSPPSGAVGKLLLSGAASAPSFVNGVIPSDEVIGKPPPSCVTVDESSSSGGFVCVFCHILLVFPHIFSHLILLPPTHLFFMDFIISSLASFVSYVTNPYPFLVFRTLITFPYSENISFKCPVVFFSSRLNTMIGFASAYCRHRLPRSS